METTVKLFDLAKFKNCVLFSIKIRRFGNSAKIKNMTALEQYIQEAKATGAKLPEGIIVATDRVKSSKMLLKSKTYTELCQSLMAIKQWCLGKSMPAMFRTGMFVVRDTEVESIEAYVKGALDKLKADDGPLEKFLEAYPADVEAARTAPVKEGGLGPLFDENDYPTPEAMRDLFDLEWDWLTLAVPDNIPDSLKAEANEKFARRMQDAASDIEAALREEFLELIKTAESRLTPDEKGNQKKFKKNTLEKVAAFLEAFNSKNIFADQQLAALVTEAKTLMLDDKGAMKMNPDKIRELANVREEARKGFESIRSKMEEMMEDKPARKFGKLEE